MRKLIYMALTLASAISIAGCSRPITENELAAIQEADTDSIHSTPTPQGEAQAAASNKKVAPDTTAADAASVQVSSAQESSLQEPSLQASSDISQAPIETTIELEGMKETVRMSMNTSDLGYQMSYDIDRFTSTTEDGFDYYRVENPDSTYYPDIYIKVGKISKVDGTDFLEQTKETLIAENPEYQENTDVLLGTYKTTQFHLTTGKEWNSIIKNIYLIETEHSYYSIETQNYLEAEEGFGARIKAILDTFTLK